VPAGLQLSFVQAVDPVRGVVESLDVPAPRGNLSREFEGVCLRLRGRNEVHGYRANIPVGAVGPNRPVLSSEFAERVEQPGILDLGQFHRLVMIDSG